MKYYRKLAGAPPNIAIAGKCLGSVPLPVSDADAKKDRRHIQHLTKNGFIQEVVPEVDDTVSSEPEPGPDLTELFDDFKDPAKRQEAIEALQAGDGARFTALHMEALVPPEPEEPAEKEVDEDADEPVGLDDLEDPPEEKDADVGEDSQADGEEEGDLGEETGPGAPAETDEPEDLEEKPEEVEVTYDLSVLDGNIGDLEAFLETCEDADHVLALRDAEQSGKTRTGAMKALDAKIVSMED